MINLIKSFNQDNEMVKSISSEIYLSNFGIDWTIETIRIFWILGDECVIKRHVLHERLR